MADDIAVGSHGAEMLLVEEASLSINDQNVERRQEALQYYTGR